MLGLITLIVTCFVNLTLGLLVLLRNPHKKVSVVFFLTSLFISLWAVSNYITGSAAYGLTINGVFNRAAFLSAFLAIATALWFSTLFPRPVHWSKTTVRALLSVTLAVSVLSITNSIAGIVDSKGGELRFSVGPLVVIYIVAIAIFLGLIAKNFVDAYRKTRGNIRQQAIFLLTGFSVPIVLGLVSNVILPSLTGNWGAADFGPSFSIILVGIFSFAIIRHHLFDIKLALARSFAYVLSLAALVALYAATAFSISSLFLGGAITGRQELFFAGFSAVVALLFQPVKNFFDKITNRLFYRDAYDSQSFVDELNRSLVSYTDFDHLMIETSTIIKNNFKAEFCLFGVTDPANDRKTLIVGSDKRDISKEDFIASRHLLPRPGSNIIVTDDLGLEHGKLKNSLDKNHVALVVHLTGGVEESENLGHLIIGNKKSGNPYSTQDIKMVDIISNGLVVALQNAMRFEEIQHFNVTLQEKIDDATRQLRRTNEKLRKLDETKDDFISMASHQLRTPLTSVKGYVSMVLDGDAGKITPLQRKLLTQSFISSQRMVYLISDLLNVSRLKTGKFIIEPMPTNLAVVIQEEVEQLIETAKGRNLELSFNMPEHFPTLLLDDTKIRQVIMNFIDNAVYYTPSGGHIVVNLVEKPKTIEFTVVDDGIGVPRHEQHHLFSKFFRAPNAKRARPDGTGLGLFMAKKVIIAQGGAVIFHSQEGRGSTFGFTFAKEKLTPPQQA